MNSKSTKYFIVTLSGAVLFFSLYGYYIFTTFKLVDEIRRINLEIAVADQNDRNYREAKGNIELTRDLQKELDQYLVGSQGVVDFITLLETVGQEIGLGIEISNVAVSDVTDPAPVVEKISLRVSTRGSFVAINQLLRVLESLPYASQVENFAFERIFDGVNRTNPDWFATYDLTVFKLI